MVGASDMGTAKKLALIPEALSLSVKMTFARCCK